MKTHHVVSKMEIIKTIVYLKDRNKNDDDLDMIRKMLELVLDCSGDAELILNLCEKVKTHI